MDSFERPNSNPIATQQQQQPNTWPTMMMTTMFATTTKTRSKFQTEHWSRQIRMRFLHSQCIFSNKVSAELQQQLMVFFRRARNSISKPKFELYLHSKYRYKRVPICIHTHRIQLQTACVLFSFCFFLSALILFLCVFIDLVWAPRSFFLSLVTHRIKPFGTSKCNFACIRKKAHTHGHHGQKNHISYLLKRLDVCTRYIRSVCVLLLLCFKLPKHLHDHAFYLHLRPR